MSRNRRIVVAAIAVAVLAAAVGTVALLRGGGSSSTGSPSAPAASINAEPIANLATGAFGISTGVQLFNEQPAKIDSDIAGIARLGAHWIRTAVRWDRVEPDSADSDDWSTPDRIVADAQKGGVELIINLTGTPKWARPSGAPASQFAPDLHTYAAFAGKLAARYQGKVAAYELGNEPNHTKSFAEPDPKLYEQVLELSYPLIKAADPDALVLTGGLGGKSGKGVLGGDEFLAGLYKAGAKPFFDGVSYHPYTYPLLPSADTGKRSWSRMLNARKTMVANGDAAKKVWATEYGAPTGGPNSVDQEHQAAIMYDAYRLWASYSWAGPLCWFDYRDKGTDTSDHGNFFGLYTNADQPKVALMQYQSLLRTAR